MVKCIIIDDEPKARNLLEAVIQQYCPSLTIMALCEDLPTGIKAIKKHNPSLIFLDIEMPGHSGLELMDFFNEEEVNFSIIFTTAYNNYAIDAFKLSAIDYLLKPIQHNQLIDSVNRFLNKENRKQNEQLKALQQNLLLGNDWENKRIVIPSGQSLHFFKPNEIIYIKGEASYSEIYFLNGDKMLASRNLKHFEELLKDIPVFFRCHKSYIVNTTFIKQYVKSDGGYLQMINNTTIGISNDRTEELLARIGK